MNNVRRGYILILTISLIASGIIAACDVAIADPPNAVCDALRAELPTWSRVDTEASKREAARFLDVFQAVCGGPKE